ncbi:MAG: pyridoxal-phosphate-dependent aminotransferase family protein [Fervidicoccaceae archaeon]|nr:MAG: alanine--glyoxylate aminotransferase family protein [Fervidicoccus sp.]
MERKREINLFTHKYILTPGPTEMPRELLLSILKDVTNPDLDPQFYDFYHGIFQKLARIFESWNHRALILLGEGMLGLESSVVNMLNRGEKGLVFSNGFFGDGFSDLIEMTDRKAIKCRWNEREAIPPEEAIEAISRNNEASAVYMVHCETPTGILNPIDKIGPAISETGKLFIVDAVSSMFTLPIKAEEWGIDILIGGSQKALNLPPGLTILLISNNAWRRALSVEPNSFYLSFKVWEGFLENKESMPPYTLSMNLLRALDDSLANILREGEDTVYSRHLKIREASWSAAIALGLEPFPKKIEDSCPGVTAILMPEGISSIEAANWIYNNYGVMLGIGLGNFRDRILRIGHMGFTASIDYIILTYTALGNYLVSKGIASKTDISEALEAIFRILNG